MYTCSHLHVHCVLLFGGQLYATTQLFCAMQHTHMCVIFVADEIKYIHIDQQKQTRWVKGGDWSGWWEGRGKQFMVPILNSVPLSAE